MQKFVVDASNQCNAVLYLSALELLIANLSQESKEHYRELFNLCTPRTTNSKGQEFVALLHRTDFDPSEVNMRKELVTLLEWYTGDLSALDKANHGSMLRIVEVPDNIKCMYSFDDFGHEYVIEVHQWYYPDQDWLYDAKRKITYFCRANSYNVCDSITEPTEYQSIRLVFDGTYGMAEVLDDEHKKHYIMLRKNEYYRATKDRPKILYEIETPVPGPAMAHSTCAYDADRVEAHMRLYLQLTGKSR